MGVSGGGLMSVAQMIVSDIVPLRERGKYQGILVRWNYYGFINTTHSIRDRWWR
jgi:MFS family permease